MTEEDFLHVLILFDFFYLYNVSANHVRRDAAIGFCLSSPIILRRHRHYGRSFAGCDLLRSSRTKMSG